MSVWTKIKSEVLKSNVDMDIFKESIKELKLELDYSRTKIENYFGKEMVDASFKYKNKNTNLGIIMTETKGLDIVGDTWGSEIVKDNELNKFVNMVSQVYQSHKLKKELENVGWDVIVNKKDNKIELELSMW